MKRQTFRIIVKFIYIVILPLLLISIDLMLYKLGKWEQITDSGMQLGILIIFHLLGIACMWMMITAHRYKLM